MYVFIVYSPSTVKVEATFMAGIVNEVPLKGACSTSLIEDGTLAEDGE